MNEIGKNLTAEEVTDVVLSYNDPNLVANVFKQLRWSPSLEIVEVLKLARQDTNLSVKLRAIKQLREMMKDAAEASGLIANVSQSQPLPGGGSTTFQAKRVVSAMNPTKKIESNQIGDQNNEQEREESNRAGDRPEGGRTDDPSAGCRTDDGTGDDKLGRSTDGDDGEATGPGGGLHPTDEHPCEKTRRPECNQKLFPGISTSTKGE